MSAVSPLQPISPEALPNYEQEDVSLPCRRRRRLAQTSSQHTCMSSPHPSVTVFNRWLSACAMDHEKARQDLELFPEGSVVVLKDVICALAVGSMIGRVAVSSLETFKATGTNIICLSAVSGSNDLLLGLANDCNHGRSGVIRPRFSFLV